MYEKAELNILKNRVTNLELEIMSLKAEIKFLRMDIVHTMSLSGIKKLKHGNNN